MSVSERLRTLLPPGDRVVPVFRKTGPLMAGADAFTRAEDIEALRSALPEIVAVVRWVERYADAEDWHAYVGQDGRRIDPEADALLSSLEKKLKS